MTTFAEIGLHFPLFEAPISDAAVEEPGECAACGQRAAIRFEGACYKCFREGLVDHTMDTEFGMVGAAEAVVGVTHGVPMDPRALPDLPLVPHEVDPNFPNETWYGVRIPPEELLEITRTPGYHTWQGEYWLFCCGRPCIFVGSLRQQELERLARAQTCSPERLLADMLAITLADVADMLPLDNPGLGVYAFRCQECGTKRAHWDSD